MDKVINYQEIIKRVLNKYIEQCAENKTNGVENLLITDDEHGHYMLLNLGWVGNKRFNNESVYVRLVNEKYWIESDFTEFGIANELILAGVPKEDIVLAFHSPFMRQYTDFAAA